MINNPFSVFGQVGWAKHCRHHSAHNGSCSVLGSAQCTVHGALCMVNSAQCMVPSAWYTVHSAWDSAYTGHSSVLGSAQYPSTAHSVAVCTDGEPVSEGRAHLCTVSTRHSPLDSAHLKLCNPLLCTLRTTYSLLHTFHIAQMHSILQVYKLL